MMLLMFFLLTVPDNLSDIDMQNILKKEYGKNGIYKNGFVLKA